MELGLSVDGGGVSATLSPSPRAEASSVGASFFGGGAKGGASGVARGGSPTTVLWRAFDGVAGAGASPVAGSEDGGEGGAASLAQHLERTERLLDATNDADTAAGAALMELERFDVVEHLSLQTRVLKAERNLLDAQLAADEGALGHIQAMSAAVADVDDVAAVALSMARLGVLDAAESRLAALRARQRQMVDDLMRQLRGQRDALRYALNDVAPGLDTWVAPGGCALMAAGAEAEADAYATAMVAHMQQVQQQAAAQVTRGWRGALGWAKAQLPGVLMGAVGMLLMTAARQTAARSGAARAAAQAAQAAAEDAADMRAARSRGARRPHGERVDCEQMGFTRITPRDGHVIFAAAGPAAEEPAVVSHVSIPVVPMPMHAGAAADTEAAQARAAAAPAPAAPPAESSAVLEV